MGLSFGIVFLILILVFVYQKCKKPSAGDPTDDDLRVTKNAVYKPHLNEEKAER